MHVRTTNLDRFTFDIGVYPVHVMEIDSSRIRLPTSLKGTVRFEAVQPKVWKVCKVLQDKMVYLPWSNSSAARPDPRPQCLGGSRAF